MKHFYLGLLLCAASLSTGFAQRADRLGKILPVKEAQVRNVYAPAARVEAEDLLGCPEGTVLGGEFSSGEGNYVGFQSSDQGRPGMATKYYQSFSECYNTVNAVRVLGLFNYFDEEDYDWYPCNSRGGIDESGNMTEPIRLEVSFYKMGSDGMPGECVYTKEFDLIGNNTGVAYSNCPIYEFTAELGETIKLESGFFSVSAVNMGDSPSCWLALLSCSTVPGYGVIDMGDYGMQSASLPICYCLKGTGESIAQKALKLNRILGPTESAGEKYEKVQVELMNVGSADISDARLELWADGKLLATETVNATIGSLGTYKYTFRQRIDCSEVGTHQFEVRNVTEGDEGVCADRLAFTTSKGAAGEVCQSVAGSSSYEYITRVAIGDIDNTTEGTEYGDYRDMKTTIMPGEELDLTIENVGSGVYIGVWVDWNGNGSFDDEGDFISYVTTGSIKVSVPQGVEVTDGDKTMRIVLNYDTPSACGSYYYGETEDYTLTVKRSDSSPVLALDKSYIEEYLDAQSKSTSLVISNDGSTTLTGSLAVNYSLPYSPNNRHITKASDAEKAKLMPRRAARRVASVSNPDAAADTQYTLKYDKGQRDMISLSSGNEATYATYYPGEMLANLSGMQLSSVDVYIADAAESSAVVIYGQNSQSASGDELVNQSFVPVENAWNHIELTSPVTISDKDLWVGVKLEGFGSGDYQIGVDEGPAALGFGDIVNVGGSTWWSMADLGVNSNYCLRANVTGERTPAISWLTLDKSAYSVEGSGKETVGITLDATKLSKELYEAVIEVSSNDELKSAVKVPVYLLSGETSGVGTVNAGAASALRVAVDGGAVKVNAAKALKQVKLVDVTGSVRKVENAGGHTASLSLSGVKPGLYIVSAVYADGSRDAVKVTVVNS